MPDPTLNPGEKGLNSQDLMLLRETQAPKLRVTLHQEEPGTGSDQIAKLNPCAGPNLRETSVHSGFQEQFTMCKKICLGFIPKWCISTLHPDTACPQTTLKSLQSRGLLANHAPTWTRTVSLEPQSRDQFTIKELQYSMHSLFLLTWNYLSLIQFLIFPVKFRYLFGTETK